MLHRDASPRLKLSDESLSLREALGFSRIRRDIGRRPREIGEVLLHHPESLELLLDLGALRVQGRLAAHQEHLGQTLRLRGSLQTDPFLTELGCCEWSRSSRRNPGTCNA